jgi:hypothetical protein
MSILICRLNPLVFRYMCYHEGVHLLSSPVITVGDFTRYSDLEFSHRCAQEHQHHLRV